MILGVVETGIILVSVVCFLRHSVSSSLKSALRASVSVPHVLSTKAVADITVKTPCAALVLRVGAGWESWFGCECAAAAVGIVQRWAQKDPQAAGSLHDIGREALTRALAPSNFLLAQQTAGLIGGEQRRVACLASLCQN